MPWTGPHPSALNRWATIQANYRIDYQAIYDLLTDQQQVRNWLRQTEAQLDLYSFVSYRDSLHRIELQNGFDNEIIITHGQLAPDAFLAHLFARKPIDDVAFVGSRHGRATHRMQWVMISVWNAGQNPAPLHHGVAELYRQLGGPMGQGAGSTMFSMMPTPPGQTPYLWDMLVDNENDQGENATRPEYLYGTFIGQTFPSLYIAMR